MPTVPASRTSSWGSGSRSALGLCRACRKPWQELAAETHFAASSFSVECSHARSALQKSKRARRETGTVSYASETDLASNGENNPLLGLPSAFSCTCRTKAHCVPASSTVWEPQRYADQILRGLGRRQSRLPFVCGARQRPPKPFFRQGRAGPGGLPDPALPYRSENLLLQRIEFRRSKELPQ